DGELVIEYRNENEQGWTAKARTRTPIEFAASVWDMLAGVVAVRDARRKTTGMGGEGEDAHPHRVRGVGLGHAGGGRGCRGCRNENDRRSPGARVCRAVEAASGFATRGTSRSEPDTVVVDRRRDAVAAAVGSECADGAWLRSVVHLRGPRHSRAGRRRRALGAS